MAIVINSSPGSYPSAQGDILYVVYEATKANDPVTYPDYKYVADIYIGSTLVARLKKVPQPDNKRGVFNIGDIVRNYIAVTFNPTASQTRAQELALAEFYINATVKFGEEYNFTLYTNLTVDAERSYFNHYNGRMLGQATILSNYVNLALSNRPAVTQLMRTNVNNFIPYLANSTSSISIEIKSYNGANTLVNTISTSVAPTSANDLQLLNMSVSQINNLSAGFITDAIKYFTVKIGVTSIYQFNLICEPRYEVFTVHFLNKLGGFESREFTKVSRKSLAIAKTEFGKLPYTIDASGNVNYYNANGVYNETRSIYASQYTEKLTLNTDTLTDGEYTWLSELVLSALLYIKIGDYYIPAVITQSNYNFNKQVNDKLTNLTIDFDFGDQFNAQYR